MLTEVNNYKRNLQILFNSDSLKFSHTVKAQPYIRPPPSRAVTYGDNMKIKMTRSVNYIVTISITVAIKYFMTIQQCAAVHNILRNTALM